MFFSAVVRTTVKMRVWVTLPRNISLVQVGTVLKVLVHNGEELQGSDFKLGRLTLMDLNLKLIE